jgi:mevalonate kinase
MSRNSERNTVWLVLGLTLAFSISTIALPPMPKLPKGKIKLTKAQIEKCVKTIPAFYKVFSNKKRKMLSAKRSMAPVSGLQALLLDKHSIASSKFKKFITDNGYSNKNEFIIPFSGIMMSFAYLKIESTKKKVAEKLKKMSPQMQAFLKPQLDAMEKFKKRCEKQLAPETIEAVKPYLKTISAALNSKVKK